MRLKNALEYSLSQLKESVVNMDESIYKTPDSKIMNASIGQHVRHILEMFQCLFTGYELGAVCYDKRERNLLYEVCKTSAAQEIDTILQNLNKEDKVLELQSLFGTNQVEIFPSTYNRELHYNLEHTIHHMAIIRIKIENEPGMALDPDYGVAFSTVAYKKSLELKNNTSPVQN